MPRRVSPPPSIHRPCASHRACSSAPAPVPSPPHCRLLLPPCCPFCVCVHVACKMYVCAVKVKKTNVDTFLCPLPPSSLPPHYRPFWPKPRTPCPVAAALSPHLGLTVPAFWGPEDKCRTTSTLEEGRQTPRIRREAAATTPCLAPLAAARRRLEAISLYTIWVSPVPLRPVHGYRWMGGELQRDNSGNYEEHCES